MAYSGYEITDQDRVLLLAKFNPKFYDFIGHHITWEFGVDSRTADLPPSNVKLEVTGHAYGYRLVECLLVTLTYPDGSHTVDRPDGKQLHLTWSLDREQGAKPVQSNDVIKFGMIDLIHPGIPLTVVPKFFS
jgi:hypothetical protein